MKNKNLILFFIFLLLLSLNFLIWQNSSKETICGIESCHGLEITCGKNVPEACDMMYMGGDGCRQYAECSVIGGKCEFVKSEIFENCKSCVENCEKEFQNDPTEFFNCESQCIL
jgi:hypothetical protein